MDTPRTRALALPRAAHAAGAAALIAAFAALFLPLLTPKPVAAASSPFYYTFNSAGTLYQAPSLTQSTSPYLWLQSGGELVIAGGIGETVQGSLPASDPWHVYYAAHEPISTDDGAHPQNVFLLFSRSSVLNVTAQAYIDRTADNLSNSANRHPYNGESLLARYQDSNNYYYAGIRADGYAVIKKKTDGVYRTLASAKLFPGAYSSGSDLIPKNEWIGLKFSVIDSSSGPLLELYTDAGDTGAWKLALSATDNPSTDGAAIENAGLAGIESDYADAKFDNFLVADPSGTTSADATVTATASTSTTASAPSTTSPAAPASSGATSYDAAVLADSPVMYLTMGSPSSGSEKDQTGNGHDGTYEGGTPSAVKLPDGENAADFNGSSEYLTVPSSPALSIPTTHELTWEGWIRPDTFDFPTASSDGYVDWMGKCENYSPSCEWEARIYSSSTSQNRPDRISAYVFDPSAGLGSAADWQPGMNLQAGQWLYVVAEYQTETTPSSCSSAYPGTINIWVNGVEQNFSDHQPTGCMSQYDIKPTAGNSPLDIGTMAMDTWFKGAVGKVAIYDHLLSQSQIDAHFSAMTGASVSGSCGQTCSIPVPTQ